MKNTTYVIFGLLVSLFVVGILAFVIDAQQAPPITPLQLDKEIFVPNKTETVFSSTQEIKKISSQEELRQFFSEIEKLQGVINYYSFNDEAEDVAFMARAPVPMPEPEPSSGWNSAIEESLEMTVRANSGSVSLDRTLLASEEYSTTNIQVQNVDEPDFLKNDGKYVYILSGDKLTIIDAYPAEDAKIILKIGLDIENRNLENMFLNEDRLVIFYDGRYRELSMDVYDYYPDYRSTRTTHALIMDISDKNNPIILKDYEVDGRYHDARMIGNYVYFVSQNGIDYRYPVMPVLRESSEFLIQPDVYYFDNPERNYRFNTVTAFDIFGDAVNSETYLMGDADTIYVSENNIYITYHKNLPHYYFDTLKKDRFYKVVLPLLPSLVQEQIATIEQNPSLNWYEKWQRVSELLEETYNKMSDNTREKLFSQIQKDLEEYDAKFLKESSKTVIHKITINKETLEYFDKAEVPGYLLNQFSMDEHNGNFRLATTSQYNGRHASFTHNNVYVLDENLDLVGTLENIAPDETIFSARFMGDKLYLVTFERIDPFFVIDLSQDQPKILGELKIPGFSNYLHPYDEDHIIGIGRDTKESLSGRVTTEGLKLALFDVSDFHNPKTIDTVIIGKQSTDTEILYNHKALLFDREKNILSLPVRDYERISTVDEVTGERHRITQNWLGFYIFGIDHDTGFNLRGEVEHYSGNGHDYRFDGMNRSFYIGDVLYTVSSELIKMNDLDHIENEVNQLKLFESAQIVKYVD